ARLPVRSGRLHRRHEPVTFRPRAVSKLRGAHRRGGDPMAIDPADLEILELARAGGRGEALARFHARHGARLATACRRLVRRQDDAEDALQEVLVQVDRGLPGFRGEASLYTWAFRIAVNVCLTRHRTLRDRAHHVALEDEEGRLVASPGQGGDPDVSCVTAFRVWLVEQALLSLPEGQ